MRISDWSSDGCSSDLAGRQQVSETTLHQSAPYNFPDMKGHFGPYGGSFVSETLSHALAELNEAYAHYSKDPAFLAEFHYDLKHFVGRPSPIYHAQRWSEKMGRSEEHTSELQSLMRISYAVFCL